MTRRQQCQQRPCSSSRPDAVGGQRRGADHQADLFAVNGAKPSAHQACSHPQTAWPAAQRRRWPNSQIAAPIFGSTGLLRQAADDRPRTVLVLGHQQAQASPDRSSGHEDSVRHRRTSSKITLANDRQIEGQHQGSRSASCAMKRNLLSNGRFMFRGADCSRIASSRRWRSLEPYFEVLRLANHPRIGSREDIAGNAA